MSEDGTGERTGGDGNTGWSSCCLVTCPVGSVASGLGGMPFTLSAQLFPLPGLKQNKSLASVISIPYQSSLTYLTLKEELLH